MTDLEVSDAAMRPTSDARADHFRAMAAELKQLRAAKSAPVAAKPDTEAVDIRLSQINNDLRKDEQHVSNTHEIRQVGGTTEQTTKARNLGFRWYAGMDKGETYDKNSKRNSWFIDMSRSQTDPDAAERLRRNAKLRADQDRQMGLRAISTTKGDGGELVPPLWLEEDFVRFLRPSRPFANRVTNLPLPAGTDSINIPKINTGTAVALVGTENSPVQQTDLTTTSVSSSVFTVAGGQVVSLQLLELSPLNIDTVILQDLSGAYGAYLDNLLLTGSGTGGNPTGALTLSGTHAVAASSANLIGAGGVYASITSAVAAIQVSRYMSPDSIFVNPVTWSNWLAQTDSDNRPVIVANGAGPMNAFGTFVAEYDAQGGPVGFIGGFPVFLDAQLDVTKVIVARLADLWLWESDIRAEAFQQTYASQMSVFVRLYNYASFQASRYPQSVAVVTVPAS